MTYESGEGAGTIGDAVRSKNSATMNCGPSCLAESIYYQWIRGDTGVPSRCQSIDQRGLWPYCARFESFSSNGQSHDPRKLTQFADNADMVAPTKVTEPEGPEGDLVLFERILAVGRT